MRYFICALDNIYFGIPAAQTERIIPAPRIQTDVCRIDNDGAFISLPVLFQLKDTDTPHGIILKRDHPGKTILLTPRIDVDLEIPDEGIQQLPESFTGMFRFCTGVFFTGQSAILLLNPAALTEHILAGSQASGGG